MLAIIPTISSLPMLTDPGSTPDIMNAWRTRSRACEFTNG